MKTEYLISCLIEEQLETNIHIARSTLTYPLSEKQAIKARMEDLLNAYDHACQEYFRESIQKESFELRHEKEIEALSLTEYYKNGKYEYIKGFLQKQKNKKQRKF